MNENYRALTRQYRPQTFEDIVSQEHVSSTLKNAIRNNRLSHAYMFCGPRGVGKTTMARVLARAVNQVADVVDGESLSRTLNIVEMDAASNRKIEDVRSLKEVIRVPPQNGNYKIFIIDEVHMLTKEAFNALLKTLEEPPAHAIFIFATTEPHKVLPTILSRVQRFDFKRISVSEIVQRLRKITELESIQIDEESLHVIAKRADGALRDALGLMDQAIAFCGDNIEYKELLRALNVVDRDDLFTFIDVVVKRDSHAGLTLIRDLIQGGTDIQEFLVTLTEHIRNLYVAAGSERLHLVEATEETKKRYVEQAENWSETDLMRILHLVSEAQFKLKEAQQPKVHFEILLLKLIHMSTSVELSTLIGEVQELKKNSTDRQLNEGTRTAGASQPRSMVNDAASQKTDSETKTGAEGVKADTGRREEQPGPAGNRERVSESRRKPASGKSRMNPEPEPELPQKLKPKQESPQKSGTAAGSDKEIQQVEEVPESGRPEEQSAGKQTVSEAEAKQTGGNLKTAGKQAGSMADGISSADTGLLEEEDLYGRPTLDESKGRSAGNTVEKSEEKRSAAPYSGEVSEENIPVKGINGFGDVKEMWGDFLQLLKEAAPQMLYFQMQRVDLADLKGRELFVTVDNEFACQLVEENQMKLAGLFKKKFGKALKIRCSVVRKKNEETRTLSPYEQFKELQKKDPHIRTLVDLFGAELEY